jgi:hypothetical protein
MPMDEMLGDHWHATEGHANRLTVVSGRVLRRDNGPGVPDCDEFARLCHLVERSNRT